MNSRLLIAILVLCLLPAQRVLAQGDVLSSTSIGQVRDLHYGEVLFHNFKNDYFHAMIALLVAQERGRLENHGEDARLLLGGLKLSYGMHLEAEQIFRELLAESESQVIRNRAWFFLGKLLYRKDYYQQADIALANVESPTNTALGAELRSLRANIAMRKSRPEEALEFLQDWRDMPRVWRPFGQYNQGIAHLQNGDTEAGIDALGEIANLPPVDDGVYTLRDKANLAIGYHLLGEEKYDEAKAQLNTVRLSGPYSNQALLGSGWVSTEAGDFQSALAPWTELSGRDSTDPSVQEALIAMPYAYGELGAFDQAALGYERAIRIYENERETLEQAIASVAGGEFVSQLLANAERRQRGFQLSSLSADDPALRYFPDLIASHGFQEAFKTLREVRELNANLTQWVGSVNAFDDMLITRVERYQRQLPITDDYVEQLDLVTAREKYRLWQSQISNAIDEGDLLFFAVTDDQRRWAKLKSIENRLNDLSGRPNQLYDIERSYGFTGFLGDREFDIYQSGDPLSEPERRYRQTIGNKRRRLGSVLREQGVEDIQRKSDVLRGYLQWQLQYKYFARKREVQKSHAELGREIARSEVRLASLRKTQQEVPSTFAGLDNRIAESKRRVNVLQSDVQRIQARIYRYVESLTVARLRRLQERVENYTLQAKYSLAQVYDRAASAESGVSDTPVDASEAELSDQSPEAAESADAPASEVSE